jgi:hypothetical protein
MYKIHTSVIIPVLSTHLNLCDLPSHHLDLLGLLRQTEMATTGRQWSQAWQLQWGTAVGAIGLRQRVMGEEGEGGRTRFVRLGGRQQAGRGNTRREERRRVPFGLPRVTGSDTVSGSRKMEGVEAAHATRRQHRKAVWVA